MSDAGAGAVQSRLVDDVMVVRIDHPPVNALAAAVRDGLAAEIDRALRDDAVRAIVVTGSRNRFVAGADIRGFAQAQVGTPLADIQRAMEQGGKPVVAAIEGFALGGGLELALAVAYRVATTDAEFGFPEISLGLLPGGGGTQRATRLIGPAAALDLMLSGRRITAEEARRLGLVDAVVPAAEVVAEAVRLAQRTSREPSWPRTIERTDGLAAVDPQLFADARSRNARKQPDLGAPARIVDCVEAATRLPPQEGLAFERAAFLECRAAPAHPALVHLFFAERAAMKVSGAAADAHEIRSAAIVGAGTMGGGIAMAFANAGIAVRLCDAVPAQLDAGLARIRDQYARAVDRGSRSADQAEGALARIRPAASYAELAGCDLVVEAAFEEIGVKQAIFAELDRTMAPGAILATNASTLDIDAIAGATSRPEAVVGMHFFSPANVMKLLEVVRGRRTAERVVASAMRFARAIDKVAVLAGNGEGFIANNIQHRYSLETDIMLEEGATPWQIDRILQEFGFPMGVYLMRDLAGLDVGWRIRKGRAPVPPEDYHGVIADAICELGRFGQKTGAGYYRYEGRSARPDPDVAALIERVADERGHPRRALADPEIQARVLYAMVNQGAWLLDRGIAQRAGDIDVAMVLGYGFPRHRGGPMYWAEAQGLAGILAAIEELHTIHGERWRPAPGLIAAADRGSWA